MSCNGEALREMSLIFGIQAQEILIQWSLRYWVSFATSSFKTSFLLFAFNWNMSRNSREHCVKWHADKQRTNTLKLSVSKFIELLSFQNSCQLLCSSVHHSRAERVCQANIFFTSKHGAFLHTRRYSSANRLWDPGERIISDFRVVKFKLAAS